LNNETLPFTFLLLMPLRHEHESFSLMGLKFVSLKRLFLTDIATTALVLFVPPNRPKLSSKTGSESFCVHLFLLGAQHINDIFTK